MRFEISGFEKVMFSIVIPGAMRDEKAQEGGHIMKLNAFVHLVYGGMVCSLSKI